MIKKVSDYVADFLVDNGIKTIFTVVGGGAMHLNASFGHNDQIRCVYNHHEQASSIATEAYFRVKNEMAACCVTSGPGAINALNGVVGAYQDSIPMLVISGQTKTSLMARNSGLPLRTLGNQEYDIIPTLQNATKYAETVMEAGSIRYCLEKAVYIAKEGRPGPAWIEIPLDIQGKLVETDELVGYLADCSSINDDCIDASVKQVIDKLRVAKRPVIYAGNGIRISGGKSAFDRLVETLGIPVVTCWNSIDIIDTDNRYYVGRAGIMGDRPGNFAVQNSDLLICIGTRLNIYQVGYDVSTWARAAYVIDVDIDPIEFKKPTVRIDLPICADAKFFIEKLMSASNNVSVDGWLDKCNYWKLSYPVVNNNQRAQRTPINVYGFIDYFSKYLPPNAITVVANGAASVVGSAAYYIKGNQRFIMNCGLSSMGYDLPAAIGVCLATRGENGECQKVYCIAGDGSIQMNIQELQTIVTNKLPIKVVVINNQGYHQIRLTQNNVFGGNHVGIGPQSGDLGFPCFMKLAEAYGIPYYKLDRIDNMDSVLKEFDKTEEFAMLEVFCDTEQVFEPKSATKKREDGSLYSPPLEDMMPFLPREELERNMYINMDITS